MAELWDVYDREFRKIEGAVLVRGEEIPEGKYHIVCAIAVRHEDGTYLMMQRDLHKNYGGCWELTAGGSALQGETAMESAFRELREETGIVVDELKELGHVVSDRKHIHYVDFLAVTGVAKDAVTLQEGETIAWQWLTKEEILGIDEGAQASFRMLERLKKGEI